MLSTLGSVGVVVDKASSNLPGETGGAFWGSVILLIFGILSQLANEFQIAQLAADARSLAEKCEVYDTRLENVLTDDDPRTDTATMLVEVNALFESERYNKVLPRMTGVIEREAAARSGFLINRNEGHWQLSARRQRGLDERLTTGPQTNPMSPPAPHEPPAKGNEGVTK